MLQCGALPKPSLPWARQNLPGLLLLQFPTHEDQTSSLALRKAAQQYVHGVPQRYGREVPGRRFGNALTVSSPVQVKKPL